MLTFADMGEGVSEMLTSAFFILKDNEKLRNFAFNLNKHVLIIWQKSIGFNYGIGFFIWFNPNPHKGGL